MGKDRPQSLFTMPDVVAIDILTLRVHTPSNGQYDETTLGGQIRALGQGCFATKRLDLSILTGTNAACEFIIQATKSYWGEKARVWL